MGHHVTYRSFRFYTCKRSNTYVDSVVYIICSEPFSIKVIVSAPLYIISERFGKFTRTYSNWSLTGVPNVAC